MSEPMSIKKMVAELRYSLEAFDKYWTIFEKVFLLTLNSSFMCSN